MATLHELIHVLGFSGPSMEYWINPATGSSYGSADLGLIKSSATTIRSLSTTSLMSANVLKTAKKYYNCPTLTGMQLENQVNRK